MKLVLQAPDLSTRLLKQLAQASGSSGIRQVRPGAFVLADADERHRDVVAALCAEHAVDCGWVPDTRQLGDFGLVVMDMDSTLITIECIDEIADMQGLKPQVAAITEAAMRGELDFSGSLRQRVALLEGLPQAALERVYLERLKLSAGALALTSMLRDAGIRTLLVSGGFTYFAERVQQRLWLDRAVSNTLEIVDGTLTGRVLGEIVDADVKARELAKMRDELGLAPEQVVAIGDGANDLKMMAAAELSIAYHAKPVVRAQASYALNVSGLDGALALLGAED